MVYTFGSKISDELFFKITAEISRLGLTKSQFLRLILDYYFNNQKSHEKIKVNLSENEVNQVIDEGKYEIIKREVDVCLRRLNEDLKK